MTCASFPELSAGGSVRELIATRLALGWNVPSSECADNSAKMGKEQGAPLAAVGKLEEGESPLMRMGRKEADAPNKGPKPPHAGQAAST